MLREEGKPLAGPPDLKNHHDCYLSPGFQEEKPMHIIIIKGYMS